MDDADTRVRWVVSTDRVSAVFEVRPPSIDGVTIDTDMVERWLAALPPPVATLFPPGSLRLVEHR